MILPKVTAEDGDTGRLAFGLPASSQQTREIGLVGKDEYAGASQRSRSLVSIPADAAGEYRYSFSASSSAESKAARNEQYATLGRYMTDMKHNLNNALTSLLGNAELLLLEPGELSAQSLAQIKTIHTMALRINEVMIRFSSLASEMRGTETDSQSETEEASAPLPRRR